MLFTFPSRYWFAIGLSGVFSLAGWSRLVHAEFLVLRATQDTHRLQLSFVYGTITLYGLTFQTVPLPNFLAITGSYNPTEAGTSLVWALPRSLATTGGIIVYFLFLEVLRCFSSLGSPPHKSG